MRAWVIFSTDAGSAVTAQIASDLLEPTITARPRTDRLKHRPLEKSWRCRSVVTEICRERARFGALEVFRRSEPLRRDADRGFVLSHWPSSPDRTCDAPAGVVERGHAVAMGARRAGAAACAIVKGHAGIAAADEDAEVGARLLERTLVHVRLLGRLLEVGHGLRSGEPLPFGPAGFFHARFFKPS